jgi:YebC/PmpR family DNA-binding regulatory protein
MVDCLTDNRNRTVAEVRHAFSKFGGNLGADGSVAYLFTHTGSLSYPSGRDEEKIMEVAIDAGASDIVTNDDGSLEVLCDPADFEALREALEQADLVAEQAEVTMRASTMVPVQSREAETTLKLLDVLDDLDDVQEVYSNADLPDELLEESA